MKKLLTLCMAIFFSVANYGQNSDSVFNLAVHYFNHGDTLLAQKEIQRAILFDTLNINCDKYLTAAQFFAATNDYDLAEVCVNDAFAFCKNKFSHSQILITKADLYILSKKYFKALSVLMQIDTTMSDEVFGAAMLRFGICYYCLEKYNQAYPYFAKLVPEGNELKLKKLYNKCRRLDNPSPLFAGLASAFVPGLGQYLAASFVDGFSSEVLLSSFTLIAIGLAHNYGKITAALCVLPWIQRYYFGGIKNAADCAKRRKIVKANKLLNEAIALLK